MENNEKKYYTNECPFNGSREVVDYCGHLTPQKCCACEFHYEGECRLLTNKYKRLDYPPCGISGETYLVEYTPDAEYLIPFKCSGCKFLLRLPIKNRCILFCTKDCPPGIHSYRGLDYGD